MSVFDSYRSGGGTSSGLADRVARSNDAFHKDEAKRKKKQPSAAQREAERQASVKPKKKDDGGIFGAIGDYAAGVNEKVLGGGTRAIVNAANLVGSGFNEKEASKRTKDFLTTTKQINKKGEAPLAAGEKRKSMAFKVGSSVGDTVNVANPLTTPESVIKSGVNLTKQVQIGAAKKSNNSSQGLNELKKSREWQVKSGLVSKQQADKDVAKYKKDLEASNKSIRVAEKKVGVKRASDLQNTLDVVNVVGVAAGLSGTAKKIFSKTAENAAMKAGRDLTKEEVTSIAQKVKPTVKDKFLASKPTEFIFGDKKVVQDAVAKVGAANESRASKYEVDATKPRIAPVEAEQKLKSAGYTTDESKKILEDVLPEKGLSMPGSPKKIGYKEDKILEAAKLYDGVPDAKDVLSAQTATVEPKVPTLNESVVEGSSLSPLAAKDTAEQGISKLAASTKQQAIHEKLIKKTQADTVDTPLYNKANMEQQAEYATNLIKDAPEDAVDIAMGRKAPPEHILQQMVYNAVEDHAKKIGGDKGANLLLQLSRSRQSTNLTKMGQEIRAAAERDPHSPVTMMNEVKLARAEAAKKRGKDFAAHAKKDAAAIKKATPKIKKETWESFIKELTC
jgi:hypothetical protein